MDFSLLATFVKHWQFICPKSTHGVLYVGFIMDKYQYGCVEWVSNYAQLWEA